MCGAPFEDDARVQVAETPELQRVVRGLEADDQLRLVDQACALEDAGERVLRGAELLAREEEQCEVVAELGGRRPVGELDHHGEPAFHVAGPEAHDRPVLDPAGQVPLGRHRVGVAREEDERFAAPFGEDHRLAVRIGLFQRDDGGDVAVQLQLLARFGRDVHEIQGALGECHNRDR